MRRRSAFVIFRAIKPLLSANKLLTGNKLLKNESNLSKTLLDAAGNSQSLMDDSRDMIVEQSVSSSPDASTIKSTARSRNNTVAVTAAATTATAIAHGNGQSSQNCTKPVHQQTARKSFKNCDSKKLARSNRDKMLQEKEDFQLAKMLQDCIGTSDTTSRYSLRSRFRNNKSSLSSSLSSSASSTQDLFQLKYGGSGVCTIASSKYKKSFPDSSSSNNSTNTDLLMTPSTTTTTTTSASSSTALSAAGQPNNSNDNSNDKFMEFSFQKLTRSRRIAMTMSGV